MIKKIFFNFLLIVAVAVLLKTKHFVDLIDFKGVIPDIFFLMVLFTGIFSETIFTMVFAFFCGLALDLTGFPLLGFYALIFTIIGYLTSLTKILNITHFFAMIVIFIIFYLIKVLLFTVFGLMFLDTETVVSFYLNNVLIEFCYTLILSVPLFQLYKLIYNFSRKPINYV